MIGSEGIASWVAHVAFWALLVWGIAAGELTPTRFGLFLALWLSALFGLPYVPYEPVHAMFSSFVAMLDVALVFVIFKGDVRLG